jgi:hypothetical protein
MIELNLFTILLLAIFGMSPFLAFGYYCLAHGDELFIVKEKNKEKDPTS